MRDISFLLLCSLVAAVCVAPVASAAAVSAPVPATAGPCDYFPSLCDAIALVLRLCEQAIQGCDVSWVEESVRHLCDHWLNGCKITGAAAVGVGTQLLA